MQYLYEMQCNIYILLNFFFVVQVKIAHHPYYTGSFFSFNSQMSEVMRLEKGKP